MLIGYFLECLINWKIALTTMKPCKKTNIITRGHFPTEFEIKETKPCLCKQFETFNEEVQLTPDTEKVSSVNNVKYSWRGIYLSSVKRKYVFWVTDQV